MINLSGKGLNSVYYFSFSLGYYFSFGYLFCKKIYVNLTDELNNYKYMQAVIPVYS